MAAPSPEAMQPPKPKRPKQEVKVEPATESNPEWTPEQQVEFIHLWQSCPELYDFYNDDFSNNEKRLEVCAMLGQRLSHKRSAIEVRQKIESEQASWRHDRELVRKMQMGQDVKDKGKPQLDSNTYQLLLFLENGFPKGQREEVHCLKHPILVHNDILNRARHPPNVADPDVHVDPTAFQQFRSRFLQQERPGVSVSVVVPATAVDLSRQTPVICPCQHPSPDITRYLSYIGCELTALPVAKRESTMMKISNLINQSRANLDCEDNIQRNQTTVSETNTVTSHLSTTNCKSCNTYPKVSYRESENINDTTLPIIPTPLWPNTVYPDLIPGWYQTPHFLSYFIEGERIEQTYVHPPILTSLEHSLAGLLHNTSQPSMDDSQSYPPVAVTPIPHVRNGHMSSPPLDVVHSTDSTDSIFVIP